MQQPGATRDGFKVTIRLSITTVILLTVLVTAVAIHYTWKRAFSHSAREAVRRINQEILRETSREVERLFQGAVATSAVIHDLVGMQSPGKARASQCVRIFASILKANPQYTSIGLGLASGDFMVVRGAEQGRLNLATTTWDPARRRAIRMAEVWDVGPEEPVRVSTTRAETDTYAPDRPWYQEAVRAGGPTWTGVSPLGKRGRCGVDAAVPIIEGGRVRGVVMVGIELGHLCAYLEKIKVASNGTVVIIDEQRNVIASQNPKEAARAVNGKPVFKRLGDSEDPLLQTADAVLAQDEPGYRALLEPESTGSFLQSRRGASGAYYWVAVAPLRLERPAGTTVGVERPLRWMVGTVVPSDDVMPDRRSTVQATFTIVVVLVMAGCAVGMWVARFAVVDPLMRITRQAEHIRDFNVERLEETRSFIFEVRQLSEAMVQMGAGLASFQKYVPTELVRKLISQGIEARLGGQEQRVTVHFSDIEGFTSITESMGSSLVPHLAEYFGEMSSLISQGGGTIDKFIGDCIMAFWGAPVEDEQHAVRACRAALQCQGRLAELGRQWEAQGRPALRARVGINTGTVLVGNIGWERKMDYTVVGDAVNVASRLEGLNRVYGTRILIGSETFEAARDEITARRVDRVAVYGKQERTDIYELLAMKDAPQGGDFGFIAPFEEGLTLYGEGDFAAARERFDEALRLRDGHDGPSSLFIARCNERIASPPGEGWDGSTIMQEK